MNPTDRILIIDDDAVYRERLMRALRSRGKEVAGGWDLESTREGAEQLRPNSAVVDLKLPTCSGMDCLRLLREFDPRIRVLMLTGYGSIANALEAVREGAWDYLNKPADAEQILAALNADPGERTSSEQEFKPASLDRLEWEHIQRVLADHGGNISKTAEVLGLHRRTLQRKLQKYPPSQ